jgi:enoyl-[acyl-carrier protein] reductase III
MDYALSGRALITGGTRGIGRAISLRFARAGASVIANYIRDQKSAGALESAADQEGLSIELCRADLTTPQGVEQIRKSVGDQPLSALVHCAATGVHRSLAELTPRHFDWTFALNVRAFFELVQTLADQFANPSSVIAVSSMGGSRALPYYTLVGASKAALESLARHLAVELAPRGIRVNILVPGTVETDVWKALPESDERVAAAVRQSPIGRLVTPDEVAAAAQFLCSEAASGIVGQTLIVDGGAAIRG